MGQKHHLGPEQQFYVPHKLRSMEALNATELLLRLSDNDPVVFVQAVAEHVCHLQRYKNGNAEKLLKKVLERCKHEVAALKLNRQISGAVASQYLKDRSPAKERPAIPEGGEGEGEGEGAGAGAGAGAGMRRQELAKLPPKMKPFPRRASKGTEGSKVIPYSKRMNGTYKAFGMRASGDLTGTRARWEAHALDASIYPPPSIHLDQGPKSPGGLVYESLKPRGDKGVGPGWNPDPNFKGEVRPSTAGPGRQARKEGGEPLPSTKSEVLGRKSAMSPWAGERPRSVSPFGGAGGRPGTAPALRRGSTPERVWGNGWGRPDTACMSEEEKKAYEDLKAKTRREWLADRAKRKLAAEEARRARAGKDREWINQVIEGQARRKKEREEEDRMNFAARSIQVRWRQRKNRIERSSRKEQSALQAARMQRAETMRSMSTRLLGFKELMDMKAQQKPEGSDLEEELVHDDAARLFD